MTPVVQSADAFRADPAFEAGSRHVADWDLCQVRLQTDGRFPWLILLPRIEGVTELEDLAPAQRQQLTEEMVRAGKLVRALGEVSGLGVEKLNMAALGNVTAQLHVHIVGRRREDGLWPDPIWGRPGALPMPDAVLADYLRVIREYSA
jgi:diadenosine tetraphosphate (Ap4A) HIT family hydrolase